MSLASLTAGLLAAPVLLVTSVFAVETLLGAGTPGRRQRRENKAPRAAILMPAHDEAAGVEATLRSVLPAAAGMRVLVVADNCTDETATVARAAGAEVVERRDPARRGKSYALAFGADHLRADPPDVVIVLDADCVPEAGTLQQLASLADGTGRPAQAEYLFQPRSDAGPMVEVSNFAVFIKNSVRQKGLARLGAPVVLTGTGMAFPWRLFGTADLASGSVVEDLALGIALTRQGAPPLFLASARVWSTPASAGATLQQRSRWEGGFLGTACRYALPLIGEGITRLQWRRLWLGLHLATPPLALLVLLNVLVLSLLVPAAIFAKAFGPLLALLTVQCAAAAGLLLAWTRGGKAFLPPRGLARLPGYLFWKLPLYFGLVRGRSLEWTRTDRG
jgi:cellulose synthase/poly-beta-1,6-N-acetylglucosamine synthase-like glycosyltransferase